MNSGEVRNNRDVMIIALLFILVISVRIFKGPLFLDDPFHHGEYFAAAVSFFDVQDSGYFPLTIHGALDLLPAMIARWGWGADEYFLPTFAIYKALNFVSALLFIGILWRAVNPQQSAKPILAAGVLAAPFLVGYRDVFLLGALLVCIFLWQNGSAKGRLFLLWLVLGFLLGVGLFWSYDRGIAGAVSIGTGILFYSMRHREALLSLISFILTIVCAGYLHEYFSIGHYFENIQFLWETSSQWRYELNGEIFALSLYAVFLNFFTLAAYWRGIVMKGSFVTRLGEGVALSGLAIFMLKIALNRVDFQHIYLSMWMPILLAARTQHDESNQAYGAKLWAKLLLISTILVAVIFGQLLPLYIVISTLVLLGLGIQFGRYTQVQVLKMCVLIGFFAVIGSGIRAYSKGAYDWMTLMLDRPHNSQVVDASLVWVANEILASHANCIFDMSNNGLINGLANLPSCTRFTYPVYATQAYEEEIIRALQMKRPQSVVYASTVWSYRIDGRSMAERFPLLDQYLLSAYPLKECSFGYCVGKVGN